MRRADSRSGTVPVLPLLLVVVGALTTVTGVAVPIRSLPGGPVAIVTGGVSPTSAPVLAGGGLCLAGIAALVLGTLLLTFDRGLC